MRWKWKFPRWLSCSHACHASGVSVNKQWHQWSSRRGFLRDRGVCRQRFPCCPSLELGREVDGPQEAPGSPTAFRSNPGTVICHSPDFLFPDSATFCYFQWKWMKYIFSLLITPLSLEKSSSPEVPTSPCKSMINSVKVTIPPWALSPH